MPFTKRRSKLHIQVTNSDHATAHGGQVLVDSICRRFDLWDKIHQEGSLDPRIRKSSGFSPVSHVAQILFTLTSGGVSLADTERLGQDSVLMDLLGLEKGADQTTLGEWLRAQTRESIEVLHQINAAFVDWSCQKVQPARWRHAGEVEVFFDDTQIEVDGHQFEGARLNYEGNRALGWQTLWYGPWLLDGILDGAGDVSMHLPLLLDLHQARWAGQKSYFYADSGSSAGKYLNQIQQAGFGRWSVSYNKWFSKLDHLAAELSEKEWSVAVPGPYSFEQYTWLKHQPGECAVVQKFAAVRWKKEGDLLWHYAYRVCQPGEKDTPQGVFERHRLKGAKEQSFRDVLSGLDLHHPPCKELLANQAFYAIATLAHNVLITLKLMELPDAQQSWRVPTIIRHLLTLPVSVSTHARYTVAKICVPAGWMRWWRLFVDQWLPKRKPGYQRVKVVDSA